MRKIKLSLVTCDIIEKSNRKTPLEVFNEDLMKTIRDLNSSKFSYSFTTSNGKK